MNASHMMIKKTIIGIILGLGISLLIASYAGGEKKTDVSSSENVPETYTLNTLENRYEPVIFSHGMHTLVAEDCATCHHKSEPGQTLACKECHGAPFDPKNLNMPGLKGAYHLQCMGCHMEIGSGPLGCTECHAKKTSPKTAIDKK